ncbi:hypothetical protein LIER_08140 [Lithospermum erythrorhizon]|uniref:GATA-type domain-containing protein n=1 Tax=Lithospermum erythrorhizon TaxID=34254 RepID=A0AAV3PBG4_LITER
MDLKQDKRSDIGSTPTQIKSCTDCYTTRTPLWRGGPFGPKSLCNACGIKYNKKRRESLFGIDKTKNERPKKKIKKVVKHSHATSGGKSGIKKNKRNEIFHKLKMRLIALGTDIREEEQAAILLMALSSGSVYA